MGDLTLWMHAISALAPVHHSPVFPYHLSLVLPT